MAKNPKVKDPTEVALSAIEEALNIGDLPQSGYGVLGEVELFESLQESSRSLPR